MPILGKEVEHRLSPDQIAVQEVQNYVEKIERQNETQQQVNQNQKPTTVVKQPPTDDIGKTFPGANQGTVKPKIMLPIDQNTIQTGLKKDASFGVKWLAEWCVMMIKKYPGRVFYIPPEAGR